MKYCFFITVTAFICLHYVKLFLTPALPIELSSTPRSLLHSFPIHKVFSAFEAQAVFCLSVFFTHSVNESYCSSIRTSTAYFYQVLRLHDFKLNVIHSCDAFTVNFYCSMILISCHYYDKYANIFLKYKNDFYK